MAARAWSSNRVQVVHRGPKGLVQPGSSAGDANTSGSSTGPSTPPSATSPACALVGSGTSAHWRCGSSPWASKPSSDSSPASRLPSPRVRVRRPGAGERTGRPEALTACSASVTPYSSEVCGRQREGLRIRVRSPEPAIGGSRARWLLLPPTLSVWKQPKLLRTASGKSSPGLFSLMKKAARKRSALGLFNCWRPWDRYVDLHLKICTCGLPGDQTCRLMLALRSG